MLPLLIEITNQDSGARVEAGFKRSPVRIGRNALNDLAIDEGFVSQWHGLVRFDDAGTRFLDLGSTNGTFLGKDRLEKNVEIELSEDTKLEIGPLRFRFVRMALKADQILSRRASAFQLGGTRRQAKGVGAGGTVALGGASEMSVDDLAKTIATSFSGDDLSVPLEAIKEMAQRQRDLLDRIKPLYAAYEEARTRLDAELKQALEAAPTETEREVRTSLLADSFPRAFEQSTGGAGGGGDVAEVLRVLAPTVAGQWENPYDALQRIGAVLEAFASAFLDLRESQTQIRSELGVEPGSENSLPALPGSRELLAYLLDPNVEGAARIDELARGFAEIVLHQIAMIRGAAEGTRAVLSVLSPQGIGAEAPGALAKTSIGFGDVLWPFRAAGNYYRYVGKHLEMATGERFTKYLFGSAFARAYYRITGSRG